MHSTITFQPQLLEIHLSAIALRDRDYAEYVMHTSDLHRKRVSAQVVGCSEIVIHENTKYCQLINSLNLNYMVVPDAGIFHESDAFGKQSHWTLNSSAVSCKNL